MAETLSDNFNWENKDHVVITPREGIAVYPIAGTIVIRMQGLAQGEADRFIWFSAADAQAIVDGILRVKKEIEAPPEPSELEGL